MNKEIQKVEATVVSNSSMMLSVKDVKQRLDIVMELMRSTMVDGVDYGKIPGTGGKPTLLKPGAEKLSVLFHLDPQYLTQETWHDDGHLTVKSYCTVYHAVTQARLGGASAICSTREAKYAYRKSERTCPSCGMANIRKSKQGDGYYCWAKMGGCGATFQNGDQAIESQQVGRTANPDLADSYNTVMRISEKRALVAAVRQVTGASAIFDEEQATHEKEAEPEAPPAKQPPPQQQRPTTPPVDRKAVAAVVIAGMCRCESLEELERFWKNPPPACRMPKHFMTMKDEPALSVVAALDARKLSLAKDEMEDLYEKLNYDTVKLSLLGQKLGIADIDKMTSVEAVKLVKELYAEAQSAGLMGDPEPTDAEMVAG